MGDGHQDPELPAGIDAVWLQLSFVTPALAMVVATFTLGEEAGDLSELLRRDYDYDCDVVDVHVRVHGRLGSVRARIPWSRPARYRVSSSLIRAEDQKRRASEELINAHQNACGRWFFTKFQGRLSRPVEKCPTCAG
jgi:hypothetical protein